MLDGPGSLEVFSSLIRMATKRTCWTYAAASIALVTAVACGVDAPPPYEPPPPPPADASSDTPPGPPDKTPPTLMQRVPEAGDDNVWGGAPIRLVFSEPLAPASVNDAAIRLESEAGPVAKRTSLSEDGREIRVTIESPHIGPAQLTVTAAGTITDVAGNAFAGVSWSFGVPLWQRPGGAVVGAGQGPLRPALALDPSGYPVVAWQDGAAIRVSRLSAGQWQKLGAEIAVSPGATARSPRVAVTSTGEPIVAWQESANETHIYVKRYRGDAWELVGTGPIDAGAGRDAAEPVVVIDEDDRPVVAWIADKNRVEIRRWEGAAWQPLAAAWDAGTALADLAFATQGNMAVVAVSAKGAKSSDLRVVLWNRNSAKWAPLGGPLDHAIDDAAVRPSLAISRDDVIGVAWQEHDGFSDNVYVATYDEFVGAWSHKGHALDLDPDAPATSPSLGFTREGVPVVAWSESRDDGPHTYVGRFNGTRWEVPGAGLDPIGARSSDSAALVVDGGGNPVLAWETVGGGDAGAVAEVQARRYNGGNELRFGLAERVPPPCTFPEQGAPEFPRTLTATKCFTDVPRRVPAPGLIPYDVNSPLWSDGALKRRFIVMPEAGNIGFNDKFAWTMPVGTILVKEFLIEREPGNPGTIYPMETRFLYKRCEPGLCRAAWEGYSYQWNEAGTEATLLDNGNETLFKDWPSGGSLHRHSYPGRDECRQCHANVAGGVLGLATAQMNRNFDYDGIVDNQLRAFAHAGLFGSGPSMDGGADGGPTDGGTTDGGASVDGGTSADAASGDAANADGCTPTEGGASDVCTSADGGAPPANDFPFGPLDAMPKLPTPGDPAYSVNERMRSYFHSNCSHCHRPDGRWPVIDFLYDSPLIGENEPNANICNELMPGDSENSRIYIKDSTRLDNLPPDFFGSPMPPLATLIADKRQLAVLKRWIDEMPSCP